MTRRPCIIVDVDGTLADASHRQHYIDRALPSSKRDWKSFFNPALVLLDAPILHIIDLVRVYHQSAHLIPALVIVTGRPDRLFDTTYRWLRRYGIEPNNLLTRADGDFRPDDVVKEEILIHQILPHFNPIMAFDDRDRVVAMWRANGIPCLQVAPGDF
jgi:hypothetical protein